MNVVDRVREPSTWAGLGLLCQGVADLITSRGGDGQAWATVFAGVAAVFVREGGR